MVITVICGQRSSVCRSSSVIPPSRHGHRDQVDAGQRGLGHQLLVLCRPAHPAGQQQHRMLGAGRAAVTAIPADPLVVHGLLPVSVIAVSSRRMGTSPER
jgi:hypothetical protein